MVVVLHGNTDLVRPIRAELTARGFAKNGPSDCPFVTAVVRTHKDQLILEIEDSDGRHAERTLATSSSVVNVLDAWVRAGLETPTVSPVTPPSPTVETTAPPTVGTSRVTIGIGGEFGVGFDGSVWLGGHLPISISVGKVALGAAVAFLADPHWSGASGKLSTSRTLTDVTAFVTYPLSLKGFRLNLGADVGVSFSSLKKVSSITLSAGESDEPEDAAEHSVTTTGYAEAEETGLVLGAHVLPYFSLRRGFRVFFGVSISFYPLATTDNRMDTETGILLSGAPLGVVLFCLGLEYRL